MGRSGVQAEGPFWPFSKHKVAEVCQTRLWMGKIYFQYWDEQKHLPTLWPKGVCPSVPSTMLKQGMAWQKNANVVMVGPSLIESVHCGPFAFKDVEMHGNHPLEPWRNRTQNGPGVLGSNQTGRFASSKRHVWAHCKKHPLQLETNWNTYKGPTNSETQLRNLQRYNNF